MFFFWRRKRNTVCNKIDIIVENFKYTIEHKLYNIDYSQISNDMEYVMQRFCDASGVIYFPKKWKVCYDKEVLIVEQISGKSNRLTSPINEDFIRDVSNLMMNIRAKRVPKGSYEVVACEKDCISCKRTPLNEKYKRIITDDQCVICLEDFQHQIAGKLTCGHFFHRQCMYYCFRPKSIETRNRLTREVVNSKEVERVCPICRCSFK